MSAATAAFSGPAGHRPALVGSGVPSSQALRDSSAAVWAEKRAGGGCASPSHSGWTRSAAGAACQQSVICQMLERLGARGRCVREGRVRAVPGSSHDNTVVIVFPCWSLILTSLGKNNKIASGSFN